MTNEDINRESTESNPTQAAEAEESQEAQASEAAQEEAESSDGKVPESMEAGSEGTEAASEASDLADKAAESASEAVAATPEDPGTEGGEIEGASSGLPQFDNPNLRWYVVHTYSMYEDKAKTALEERIKQFGAEDKFGSILVPKTHSEKVLKSGKKKQVSKTSFPGYILVQMEMGDDTGHIVRDTPKITGFVGNAKNPRPVSDREVLRLTAPDQVKEEKKAAVSTLTFDKGETIKVTDGAFTNFDGIVEAVDASKMKLRILVSIFGRETPVELDYSQVQKL